MSFRIAEKQALKSTHAKHRMGAVIVKGGRVLATGYNELRPSSIIGRPTLHAEASAILKLLKENRLEDLIGSTLYVTRFTRGGTISCSRPCEHCTNLIRSVGIRSVLFISEEGSTETMKL